MNRSYFEVRREDVLEATDDCGRIPIEEFVEEVLAGFCYNRIQGLNALFHVLVETPGLEQHAKVASIALTAWQIGIETIHASRKP